MLKVGSSLTTFNRVTIYNALEKAWDTCNNSQLTIRLHVQARDLVPNGTNES